MLKGKARVQRESGRRTEIDAYRQTLQTREAQRDADLIKINTVRQESNHREREEGKHRGVALMGSIDRASVQGSVAVSMVTHPSSAR